VSVDTDEVGVMAAYSDPLCVCVFHCIGRHSIVILAKHCTRLPEDGSSVIRDMLELF